MLEKQPKCISITVSACLIPYVRFIIAKLYYSSYIANLINVFGACRRATPLNLSTKVWLEQHVRSYRSCRDGLASPSNTFILEGVVHGHHICKQIRVGRETTDRSDLVRLVLVEFGWMLARLPMAKNIDGDSW